MSQQHQEEKLTAEDLQYLRIAIIFAISHPDIQEMSKTAFALEVLQKKIDRLYSKEKAIA